MRTRKITIEISDGEDTNELFTKIWETLNTTFAKNLDALHDILSEYGDGMTINIKKGDKVPENVKKLLDDLQKELDNFKVVFEDCDSTEGKAGKPSHTGNDSSQPSFWKRWLRIVLWATSITVILAFWKACSQL